MDGRRFDQVARVVGSQHSRRQAIKATLGLVLAGFAGVRSTTDASATAICILTCPPDITQANDLNQCGAVVTYPPPTPSGVCGAIICAPASGSFFPVGSTPVTCTEPTLGGACGFQITVNDTQPPAIVCPENQSVIAEPPAIVNYPPPTIADNCPGVTTICVPASGSSYPEGETEVTCTATDASGNSAACSFDIAVESPTPTPTETATATASPSVTPTGEATSAPTATATTPPVVGPTEDPGDVTQLPDTGAGEAGGRPWIVPAGIVGAGAALAARIGLRTQRDSNTGTQ